MEHRPMHRSLPVLDRRVTALPTEECPMEIWVEGMWQACIWHPRTPESQAMEGYLGTARTINRPIKIGYHAWRQNEYEFVFYCLTEETKWGNPMIAARTEALEQLHPVKAEGCTVPPCDKCGGVQTQLGGLEFGPPQTVFDSAGVKLPGLWCQKLHVCVSCSSATKTETHALATSKVPS